MTVETYAEIANKFGILTLLVAILCFIVVTVVIFLIWYIKRHSKSQENLLQITINKLIAKTEEQIKPNHGDATMIYLKAINGLEGMACYTHGAVNADRIAIFSFHNGIRTLSGFPFIKKSCLAEWVTLNTTKRRITTEKDQPLNAIVYNFLELANTGRSGIRKIEELDNIDLIKAVGLLSKTTKLFAITLVKDDEGNTLGYVLAEWIDRAPIEGQDCLVAAELSRLADRTSTILRLSTMQELKNYLGRIKKIAVIDGEEKEGGE